MTRYTGEPQTNPGRRSAQEQTQRREHTEDEEENGRRVGAQSVHLGGQWEITRAETKRKKRFQCGRDGLSLVVMATSKQMAASLPVSPFSQLTGLKLTRRQVDIPAYLCSLSMQKTQHYATAERNSKRSWCISKSCY